MLLADASDKEYWANASLPWFDNITIGLYMSSVLTRCYPGSILEEFLRRRK
jgi:hypothetical protein